MRRPAASNGSGAGQTTRRHLLKTMVTMNRTEFVFAGGRRWQGHGARGRAGPPGKRGSWAGCMPAQY